MKALITGGSGFVGPHLATHLEAAGDEVVSVDQANGPDLLDPRGWDEMVATDRPDVIYHLAGWSDVGQSWKEPIDTFQTNVMGTVSVLEAARRAGTERVVLVSSADVYGLVEANDLPLTENHPARPRSPYGASKQAVEDLALQYQRGWGLGVVIARPFNHIGPGQSPRFATAAFADQIARAEATSSQGSAEPLSHGDLSPKRDLTDVRDVVRAYRLLAIDGEPGQRYNVCSGRAVAMSEVLDHLLALTDLPIETTTDDALIRPVDLPVLRGAWDKLHTRTGWQPEIGLDQSLSDVLDEARRRRSAVGVES